MVLELTSCSDTRNRPVPGYLSAKYWIGGVSSETHIKRGNVNFKFRTGLITSPMTDPVWFFKRPGPVRIGNKITPVYGTFFASE